MPKQIGWSNESNLLYQISQQITRLINVTGTNGGVGSITGSGTTNYITKWTSSSSLNNSVIYQSSTGNIGIGTTTPSQKLNVVGNILANYIIANNDLYGVALRVNGIYPNSLTYVPFYSNESPFGEIMRIQNDGSVLIGTTIPYGYKLQVNGGIFASLDSVISSAFIGTVFSLTSTATFSHKDRSTGGDYSLLSDSIGNTIVNATGTGIIEFRHGNVNRLKMFSNGNVLINGTDDVTQSKLTVVSTTQGSIPLPRMTTAQIKDIASPVNGLMAYSTNEFVPCFYDSGAARWEKFNHSTL